MEIPTLFSSQKKTNIKLIDDANKNKNYIYVYIYTCVTVPIYDLYSEHRSWILIPDDLTRKELCQVTSFIVTSIFSSFMYRSLVFFWFSLSLRLAKSSFVKSTPLHSSRKSFRNLAEKNIIFFLLFYELIVFKRCNYHNIKQNILFN